MMYPYITLPDEKLGSLELPEVDITEQKEEPTKKRMTKLELLKKRRGQ